MRDPLLRPEASRVLAVITFFFRADKLKFLFQVAKTLGSFPVKALDLVIITNTAVSEEVDTLTALVAPLIVPPQYSSDSFRSFTVRSFPDLEDNEHLPWMHKKLISNEFLFSIPKYTHFLSLEDDIEFTYQGFCYFVDYREALGRRGLIPSYVRVEYQQATQTLFTTDQMGPTIARNRAAVSIDGYDFMALENPYSSLLLLDRDLATEYVKTRSFSMERSAELYDWPIKERATMGLCFENVPAGFTCRHVVPAHPNTLQVPNPCWIYHLPNNYAEDPESPFGKIRISDIFRAC